MIVEERIYTIEIGKIPDFYAYYQEHGLATQQRILGHLIGYFHSEIGTLNQVIHLWGYENLGDREHRRTELALDPEWQNYLRNSPPYIISQESRILVPAPFSPIR